MPLALIDAQPLLQQISRTDPNPRARVRAQGLLVLCASPSQAQAATVLGTGTKQLRAWTERFLAEGRDGLVDRPRPGRPPKLDATAEIFIDGVLAELPTVYGYPTASWTLADLTDLLGRRGWVVSLSTVARHLHAWGYRYRLPRHDLRHRQDADAVAALTLAVLPKRGLITAAECASSTSMSASCTPIPTWQRSGNGEERPTPSPPPGSTSE